MDHLLLNPNAGDGRDASFWRPHLAACGIDIGGRVITELSAIGELDSGDRVLVAGGDGTMNGVVPYCIEAGCCMAVLPSGTGNDFARGLDIPLEAADACAVLVSGRCREMDVGVVGGQPFLNVAHVGIGSKVSHEVDGGDKSAWGRFSYLRQLFKHVAQRRGFRADIQCGGQVQRGRWLEIAVANGRSFGGGHEIVGASPFDGNLNIVGVRPRSALALLGNWLGMHLLGKPPMQSVLVTLRGSDCEISHCEPQTIMADGEEAGQVPATFKVRHAALRVMVPGFDTN